MDFKKTMIICVAVMSVLAIAEPAGAFLWPPAIGSYGCGGLFGIYGPNGIRGPPVPVPVPVPVAAPVPVPVPAPVPVCGGFGGCGPVPYSPLICGPC